MMTGQLASFECANLTQLLNCRHFERTCSSLSCNNPIIMQQLAII